MSFRLQSLLVSFICFVALPVWANADSTRRVIDTLRHSIIGNPASEHTFRQVIKQAELNQGLFYDPLQGIQGKTLGLWMVQPNGDPTGQLETYSPGFSSAASNTRPLVVIDGIPNRLFSSVHPQDIDSIVVLRDAAALRAYGSRGLNGVLLITTRKPQQGLPGIQVDYATKAAFESPGHYQNLLSADQWRQYVIGYPSSLKPYDGQANTNWQREISQAVVNTDQLLTVAGALPKGDASLSIGYLNNNGVIKTTGLKRFSTRLDIGYRWWANRLKLVASGWLTTSSEQPMPASLADVVQVANPTITPTIRNLQLPSGLPFINPFSILDSVNHSAHSHQSGYRAALYLNPLPNLLFSAQQTQNYYKADLNRLDTRLKPFTPDALLLSLLSEADKQSLYATLARVNAGENNYSFNLSTTDLALQYQRTLKKIGFTAWMQYTRTQAQINLFVSQLTATESLVYRTENASPTTFHALGAGLDITLFQKLFVNLAYRQENDVPASVRIRSSGPARFPLLSLRWQVKPTFSAEYIWTKSEPLHASGLRLESGLPLSLLNVSQLGTQRPVQELFFQQVGRLSYQPKRGQITLEYIQSDKRTQSGSIAYIGYSGSPISFLSYEYTVRQQGVNLLVDSPLWKFSNYSIHSTLIAGYLHTQVQQQNTAYAAIPLGYFEPFSPFTSYYGYRLDQIAGKFKRQDVNGDGKLDGYDQTSIGQPAPFLTLGWSTYFTWRRLSVSMLWRAAFGGSVPMPLEKSVQLASSNWYQGLKIGERDYLNEVIALRKTGTYDSETNATYFQPNNQLLQSTNFLRLDNVGISYRFQYGSFPLTLALFGQNLFRFSPYKGTDPERAYEDTVYSSSSAFYYKPSIIGLGLTIGLKRS